VFKSNRSSATDETMRNEAGLSLHNRAKLKFSLVGSIQSVSSAPFRGKPSTPRVSRISTIDVDPAPPGGPDKRSFGKRKGFANTSIPGKPWIASVSAWAVADT
jgi:hypothetical protein